MTPEEAGAHAKRAGAKRVVITHISDELGEEWAREQAERGFGGPGRGRPRRRHLRDLDSGPSGSSSHHLSFPE